MAVTHIVSAPLPPPFVSDHKPVPSSTREVREGGEGERGRGGEGEGGEMKIEVLYHYLDLASNACTMQASKQAGKG